MAKQPFRAAGAVDRHTPMQQGGQVTADLFLTGTYAISEALDKLFTLAHDLDEENGGHAVMTALLMRVNKINSKVMSYFDSVGDEYPLYALANSIYPGREQAAEALQELLDKQRPQESKNAREADQQPQLQTKAIKEITSMETQVRHLADQFNADGRLVDVLDHAADVYAWAAKATEVDVVLSGLVSAESFLHAAWAIASSEEFDNTSLAELLTTLKEKADKLSNKFDSGGAYYEARSRREAVSRPAKRAERTEVAA